MRIYGVIPARLQSTRLPRKLLLAETGKPLLQYVWEAARRSTELTDVLIATDSEEIATVARGFGARCELTREHPSGTDRICEVISRCGQDADLIVNVQGDEPELDASNIDELVRALKSCPEAQMATLGTPIRSLEQLHAFSCVKVVRAADGRALYFSRSPIPHVRDREEAEVLAAEAPWLLHVGIYAYRPEFLRSWPALPESRLEQWEKLEQLRALEAGVRIQVAVVEHRSVGIDTPDDYARFVARTRAG